MPGDRPERFDRGAEGLVGAAPVGEEPVGLGQPGGDLFGVAKAPEPGGEDLIVTRTESGAADLGRLVPGEIELSFQRPPIPPESRQIGGELAVSPVGGAIRRRGLDAVGIEAAVDDGPHGGFPREAYVLVLGDDLHDRSQTLSQDPRRAHGTVEIGTGAASGDPAGHGHLGIVEDESAVDASLITGRPDAIGAGRVAPEKTERTEQKGLAGACLPGEGDQPRTRF